MTRINVAKPTILDVTPYTPGKSSLDGTKTPIKLSSNENPFGASPKAIEAIKKATDSVHRYPDAGCVELREGLAALHNINADQIVCGAGSDELISLLCYAYAGSGDEVLYNQYGFLMYPISARCAGAMPVTGKDVHLRADVANLLAVVTDKTKIVFLANPNNPTGSYLTKDELQALRQGLPEHVLLVIDMAYAEYVEEDDYSNGIDLVNEYSNVVMLRTFSKLYGLANLRIGWAYCAPDIIDILNRVRGPFNVSGIAQKAAIAALKDTAFVEQSITHNNKWLSALPAALEAIGLTVYPSVGNFILVGFPEAEEKNAVAIDSYLKSEAIIGRRMEAYDLGGCMRFSIGLDNDNDALIQALTRQLA